MNIRDAKAIGEGNPRFGEISSSVMNKPLAGNNVEKRSESRWISIKAHDTRVPLLFLKHSLVNFLIVRNRK